MPETKPPRRLRRQHGRQGLGLLMVGALLLRLLVAHLMGYRSQLTAHERAYSTVAHVPKATIQAVFGAVPLAVFLERRPDDGALQDAGQTLLVMAVLAIVITAPLGAVLIDRLGARWLHEREARPE